GQRTLGDRGGPHFGQVPFGQVREGAVQVLGDDHSEYRVAEELQALIGGDAAGLVSERTVRQREYEQFGVDVHTQRGQEFLRSFRAHRSGPSSRPVSGSTSVRSCSSAAQRGSICSWACPGSA